MSSKTPKQKHPMLFTMLFCMFSVFWTARSWALEGRLPPVGISVSSKDYEQCGVDVAYAVLRWHGHDVTLESVANRVNQAVFERGMSLKEFAALLNSYGVSHMRLYGRKDVAEEWIRKRGILVIPLDTLRHLVVYVAERDGYFLRYNPPYGNATIVL